MRAFLQTSHKDAPTVPLMPEEAGDAVAYLLSLRGPALVPAAPVRQHEPGEPDGDERYRDRMAAHRAHEVAAERAAAGLLRVRDRPVDHLAGRQLLSQHIDRGAQARPGPGQVALDLLEPRPLGASLGPAHECRLPCPLSAPSRRAPS